MSSNRPINVSFWLPLSKKRLKSTMPLDNSKLIKYLLLSESSGGYIWMERRLGTLFFVLNVICSKKLLTMSTQLKRLFTLQTFVYRKLGSFVLNLLYILCTLQISKLSSLWSSFLCTWLPNLKAPFRPFLSIKGRFEII